MGVLLWGGLFLLNNSSLVPGNIWRLRSLVSKLVLAGFFTCVLVSSVSYELKLCFSAILISGLLVESRILEKLKGKVASTFKYVGDRSYSIYLVHMPLAYVIDILLPKESKSIEFINIVSKISLALILGSFLFLCIEKRFRWQKDFKPISQRQSFLLLVTPLLSLSLMSYVNSTNWSLSNVSGVESYDTLSWNANCDLNTYEIPCTFMTAAENRTSDNFKAKKNILLIGDSQAITYSKALTKFAITTDQSLIVFTRQACPFLLREDTASRNFKSDLRLDTRCLRHNDKILEFAQVNQIDKVIYAQGSPTFYLGNRESRSDDSHRYIYQTLHNLHKLRVPSSNIIIVGYGPEIRNESLNRFSYILGYRANFSDETFKDNFVLEQVAKEFGFKTLNTFNVICPHSKCSFFTNGNYVMQDSHHLSSSGAELVSRELIKLLRN